MNLGKHKIYRKISASRMYLQKDFSNSIKLHWFKSLNFGDALNPILIKFITGKNTSWIATEFYHDINYSCIGSILSQVNEDSIVWGSGFIHKNQQFAYAPPKKINAVRGPKTRSQLINLGVDCPEVYGDPALLMPQYYRPKLDKIYKIGIIPHYINKNDSSLLKYQNDPSVLIIDVMQKNPLHVINDILSCEAILSSSLHGIIIADTYGIPSQWIKFKQQVGKDDFKFHDYAESVNINLNFVEIKDITNINRISIKPISSEFNFDDHKLLNSFPIK